MPKVRRTPPPLHVVVVDTNILWDKDKKVPVSPVFDAFWNKNSPLIPMTLNVPEVVFGELQFQQTTSAFKALANINDCFVELAGITSAAYAHKCSEATIKSQVRLKLEKWLKGHAGNILATPVSSIDWASIVDAALWRKPPFTFDSKEPKTEKGFRDAIILETLAHTCATSSAGKTVIFVCNDYLLRTTAEARLRSSKKFLAFESLADFEAYINLTQQQFTNAFVKAIQSHARAKFYTKNDPNSIYIKHELWTKLQTDFSNDLALQSPPQNVLSLFAPSPATTNGTPKLLRQLFWIRSTQFNKLAGTREFQWVTHIDVVRLFELESQQGLLASAIPTIKRLQIVGFDVRWKSNVKTDGRFHDIDLDGIDKTEVKQLEATEENLKQWRIA